MRVSSPCLSRESFSYIRVHIFLLLRFKRNAVAVPVHFSLMQVLLFLFARGVFSLFPRRVSYRLLKLTRAQLEAFSSSLYVAPSFLTRHFSIFKTLPFVFTTTRRFRDAFQYKPTHPPLLIYFSLL